MSSIVQAGKISIGNPQLRVNQVIRFTGGYTACCFQACWRTFEGKTAAPLTNGKLISQGCGLKAFATDGGFFLGAFFRVIGVKPYQRLIGRIV
jgi:hypothetical protein